MPQKIGVMSVLVEEDPLLMALARQVGHVVYLSAIRQNLSARGSRNAAPDLARLVLQQLSVLLKLFRCRLRLRLCHGVSSPFPFAFRLPSIGQIDANEMPKDSTPFSAS